MQETMQKREYGKISQFLQKKLPALPQRILVAVAVTFLPIIILAIAICGISLFSTAAMMQQSYQRELNQMMVTLSDNLENARMKYENALKSYEDQMEQEDGYEEATSYDIIYDLKQIFKESNWTGVTYVYNRNTGELLMQNVGVVYSGDEAENIRRGLLSGQMLQQAEDKWMLEKVGNQYFVCYRLVYKNIRTGILIDLPDLLNNYLGKDMVKNSKIYFRQEKKTYSYQADGTFAQIKGQTWNELLRESLSMRSVYWNDRTVSFTIGIVLELGTYFGMVPVLYWILLLISIASLGLMYFLWKMIGMRVIRPMRQLYDAMDHLQQGQGGYRIDLEQVDEGETFEMQYMFQQFNAMAEEVQKSHLKDTLMLQSELDNLRLQVNPHMLLNSFNTIYSLAQVKDFATIQEFSLSLVDYFRYVLRETSTMVSIAREMDFIKTFIEIQKIRHPDTFTCVYQVEAAEEESMIPPLLIENFVENAMKHALIPGQVIEVLINIHKRDDKLQISIIDTGRGMSEEMVAELLGDHPYVDAMGKKHIGIYNCRRRLALFYGTSASFHIISALGEGTQIWIEVPYQAEEGEKNRETFDRG